MPSRHASLRTLLERGSSPRTVPTPGRLQKNPPKQILAAAEARPRGLREAGTWAEDVQHPAAHRGRPRAGAPCRSTMAAPARPSRIPPNADQKTDGELPLERLSRQDRILRTSLATKDQPSLRMLYGEPHRSESVRA